MRRNLTAVPSLVALTLLSLPSFGQMASRPARSPYTAEYKITRVQTLADGNTITSESTEVIALDAQGRHMTAITTLPASPEQPPRTLVMVFDPVARTTTNWSSPGKQATVFAIPAPGAARNCANLPQPPDVAAPSAPRVVHPAIQDLGMDTIQGVDAHGHLLTFTTPAGAIGNTEPLVRTTERWTAVAPGLAGLTLREKTVDPETGTMTRELTSLTEADPDPGTFQPPADYAIVNHPAQRTTCGNLPVKLPDGSE